MEANRSYAMDCQKSAEYWAAEYAANAKWKYQAQWAADRARLAWNDVTAGIERHRAVDGRNY